MANATTLLQTLLEYGADSVLTNHNLWDFLLFAASSGSVEVLKLAQPLIAIERFEVRDCKERTLWHLAAINGNLEVISVLESFGIKTIDATDKFGKTALHYSAEFGHSSVTSYLSTRIDINKQDSVGNTALFYALANGNVECAKALEKTDLSIKNRNGETALFSACRRSPLSYVDRLIGIGADPTETDSEGRSVAVKAVLEDDIELLSYLIKKGVNVFQEDHNGNTVAHYASQRGDVNILQLLYDTNPSSILKANFAGRSPLAFAAAWAQMESLEWFVSLKNTDFSIPDNLGDTPLHIAVSRNNVGIAKALLATGEVDVNFQNDAGETALMMAIDRWCMPVISDLIAGGLCDLNLKDGKGRTALMHAAAAGQPQVVQLLINQPRVDFRATDKAGWSPLHFAAVLPSRETARVLIESRLFQPNVITLKGMRPIDLANEQSPDVAAYLSAVTGRARVPQSLTPPPMARPGAVAGHAQRSAVAAATRGMQQAQSRALPTHVSVFSESSYEEDYEEEEEEEDEFVAMERKAKEDAGSEYDDEEDDEMYD